MDNIHEPTKVIATDNDPYHKFGTEFTCGKQKADELVDRGWVTLKPVEVSERSGPEIVNPEPKPIDEPKSQLVDVKQNVVNSPMTPENTLVESKDQPAA